MESFVFAWRHRRGIFMEINSEEWTEEWEVISTWKCLQSPVVWPDSWDVFSAYVSVLLVKLRVCACVRVCGKAALTRSPKNTSLAVKGVRSHRAFPLICTGFARTVPVVKSTQLGNTKLWHQLPESHYIGQGRTQLNWITRSQSHVGIMCFSQTC